MKEFPQNGWPRTSLALIDAFRNRILVVRLAGVPVAVISNPSERLKHRIVMQDLMCSQYDVPPIPEESKDRQTYRAVSFYASHS